jgi:hypothetical protein
MRYIVYTHTQEQQGETQMAEQHEQKPELTPTEKLEKAQQVVAFLEEIGLDKKTGFFCVLDLVIQAIDSRFTTSLIKS